MAASAAQHEQAYLGACHLLASTRPRLDHRVPCRVPPSEQVLQVARGPDDEVKRSTRR